MAKPKTSFKALILLYHQVVDREFDPFCLAVRKRNFRLHMQHLKKRYHVISMEELVHYFKKGTHRGKKCIAVSFDDGYYDNYSNAMPILEDLKIPATFFVSSGNINKEEPFWWDALIALFAPHAELPRILTITIGKLTYRWNTDRPETRQKTFFEIYFLLQRLPVSVITSITDQLRRIAKQPAAHTHRYRTMNKAEIGNAAKNPLFCIGAHTHTHPLLSAQSAQAQKKEIIKNKRLLEATTGLPIRYFSYPYGSKRSYTEQTMRLLKESGFDAACCVSQGAVTRGVNVYELPRVCVENWGLAKFRSAIEKSFSLCD